MSGDNLVNLGHLFVTPVIMLPSPSHRPFSDDQDLRARPVQAPDDSPRTSGDRFQPAVLKSASTFTSFFFRCIGSVPALLYHMSYLSHPRQFTICLDDAEHRAVHISCQGCCARGPKALPTIRVLANFELMTGAASSSCHRSPLVDSHTALSATIGRPIALEPRLHTA